MMRRHSLKLKSLRRRRAAAARAVLCLLSLGGCAAGPDFTRPVPPPASRYTAEALRGEGAAAGTQVQHIALGQQIEGAWWTLFRSDAIDDLVKQAVANNRSLTAAAA